MKSLRLLRNLSSQISRPHFTNFKNFPRFYSAQLEKESQSVFEGENGDGVFDSGQLEVPSWGNVGTVKEEARWDEKVRERAEERVFGKKMGGKGVSRAAEREEEKRRRVAGLARSLLESDLEGDVEGDEEEEVDCLEVKEEDQKSLSVGIIGAPNAGKSALTNFMV